MPKAGMAMEEGTIVRWLKEEGERVEKGEPLLEITTDKVNMEIEAEESGILLKILRFEGDVVPVTQTIAFVGRQGEKLPVEAAAMPAYTGSGADDGSTQNTSPRAGGRARPADARPGLGMGGRARPPDARPELRRPPATPRARSLAAEKGIDLEQISGTGPRGEIRAGDVVEAMKGVVATPLARRIAANESIDLSSVVGSGCRGRITKADVLAVLRPVLLGNEVRQRQPLSRIRRTIAERMWRSHAEIPAVTLDVKVDATELVALRDQLKKEGNKKITYNDFVLKATAEALEAYPYMNSSLIDGEILLKKEINLGMAVALKEGLIVPVIKRANGLSLQEFSKVSRELAEKAHAGTLRPDDCTGGSFTVSNLGMYDIVSFTPIINQPECGILGVCAVEDELRMVDGRIENRFFMGLSLSFDHRVVDGAQAALFLSKIKALLEVPERLVT
jgi:pyruvate dehydrogenase E2 component (dihydrolipoamide acetyltransferase)